MKSVAKVFSVLFLLATFVYSPFALGAAAKTLIELKDGKPVAGLAKSWKKVKDGEYEFTLDTSVELTGGKALTAGAVKSSLESKLATSHGVKVNAKGSDAVTVTYTCEEPKFLEQMSKTRIRAQSTEIALESSSEGGIRARKAGAVLADGEVKGFVSKVEKDHLVIKVGESKFNDIKKGDSIKVKGAVKGIKKNENVFFKPEAKAGDMWTPVAGTLEK
jgi:hypothetical protein